jgi:hypothetical protein
MKNLHIFGIIALLFMVSGCQLDPLPYPETFETLVEPTGAVLNKLIDGVELSNGDVIVIGTATKNGEGDLFIARIDLNGKVVDSKNFDGGGNDEISAICKDDEEELYVVGKSKTPTKKKGIVFKISPKSKAFKQVWLKDDIELKECTTLRQVQFLNNLVYVINGTEPGLQPNCNQTGFITVNKTNTPQPLIPPPCMGNYSRVGVLASVVGNGRLLYGGEDGGKGQIILADCASPKFLYSNIKFETAFNHIRGIVANADDFIIAGNIYKVELS